jgi:hypothetical protein
MDGEMEGWRDATRYALCVFALHDDDDDERMRMKMKMRMRMRMRMGGRERGGARYV